MSDTSRLEQIKNTIISGDLFPKHLGIEFLEIKPGFARVALNINNNMVNFHGITHGGVVFTLADTAFGAASNSHGYPAVALNMNVNFIKKTSPGQRITATAQEIHRTHRTALYRISIENETGEPVAIIEGLAYLKR
ncbi:PaaI family thioesterase [Desulfolucanica intricata]|uniref:PaaI family thioesterase n=1 Tax=Desulfolucanica intricata TaxID=1285191 RepID=UPI000833B435|nr:hotdog fold thioesterase [Desulfolucanica intricata]